MRSLQKELDELKETRQREKERESRRAAEDEEELQIMRDRLEKLEEEDQKIRKIYPYDLINGKYFLTSVLRTRLNPGTAYYQRWARYSSKTLMRI